MAKLVPCLVLLRATFDDLFPGRDHASDGWIGDPAHQARDSDHNPDSRGLVHAIDVDRDLGEGADMQAFVDHLVGRCRTGAEKRLTYVIFNRRIWSASHEWANRPYTGTNPHDKHAHFSASYLPARETNTTSWHLEEVPVALTEADKAWIRADNDRAAKQAAIEVWGTMFTRPDGPDAHGNTKTSAGAYQCYNDVVTNAAADRVIEALTPTA